MDDGEELIDISLFRERMAPHKYASFVGQTLRDNNKERKAVRLGKFFESMRQTGVDFSKYSKVRFYRTIRSTVPEKYSDGPITRELVFEMDVAGKRGCMKQTLVIIAILISGVFQGGEGMSAEKTVRYVALGDSYTIGTGARPEQSWPAVITERC